MKTLLIGAKTEEKKFECLFKIIRFQTISVHAELNEIRENSKQMPDILWWITF